MDVSVAYLATRLVGESCRVSFTNKYLINLASLIILELLYYNIQSRQIGLVARIIIFNVLWISLITKMTMRVPS